MQKDEGSELSQISDETRLQAIVVSHQEALQVMKKQRYEMAKTIHELKGEIAGLSNEGELARLKEENDNLKRLYGKLLHKSQSKPPPEVGEIIRNLQKEIVSLNEKINQSAAQIRYYNFEEVPRLKQALSAVQGSKLLAAPNAASPNSVTAMMRSPKNFISYEQSQRQLKLERENTRLEKDNKEKKTALAALQKYVEKFKFALKGEKQKTKSLQKKLADDNARLLIHEHDDILKASKTKLQIKKLKNEIKSLKTRFKNADSRADDTQFGLTTVKSELAGVKDKLAASQKEVEVANTELTKVKAGLAASQKEVEVANTELTKVKDYLTAFENEVSFLHDKLGELTAASRAEVEVLQAELQRYHDASGPVVGPHYAETLNLLAACFHQHDAANKVELYLKGDVQDHPLKPHGDIDLYVSLIVGGEEKIDQAFQQAYLKHIANRIPSTIFNITKLKRSEGYSNIKFSQQGTSFDCCLYTKQRHAVLNESSMFTAGAGLTPIVFSDGTYSYGERIYSEDFKSYILNLTLYNGYAGKSLPGEISATGGDAPADDDLGFQAFMKEYAGRLPFDYTSSEPPNVTHADLKFLIKNCIRCKALGVGVTPRMKSLVTDLIESIPEDLDSGFQPYQLQMLFQSVDCFYIRKLLVGDCKSDWLIRAIINKYAPFEHYIDGLCEFESIAANFQLHLATAENGDGSVPSASVSSVSRSSFFPPSPFQGLNQASSGHSARK